MFFLFLLAMMPNVVVICLSEGEGLDTNSTVSKVYFLSCESTIRIVAGEPDEETCEM